MSDIETIPGIRTLVTRWLGDEPAFRYVDSLAALSRCTAHGIAVLGVEVLRKEGDQYQVLGFSTYDSGETGRWIESALRENDWRSYVQRNNISAEKYIQSEGRHEDVLYLFTAASRREIPPAGERLRAETASERQERAAPTDQYPSAHASRGTLSVCFSGTPPTEIAEVKCMLDMDDFGEVGGIEVLDWHKQLPRGAVLDTARGCGPVRWAYDDEIDAIYIHVSKARAQVQRSARATVALDHSRRVVRLEVSVPPLGRVGTH